MANIVGQVNLSGCNYQVGYDLLGQNIAGNYSTVRFYGILNVTGTYVSWSRGTASVWGASAGLATRYNRGSYTVVTQDVNIGHDNQGNYSGTISGSLSTTFVSGTASGGFSLPSIPRQANVTGATDFTDEQNPRITFNNPGGFRINARLEFGGTSIQRDNIPNTGSYTFNLTDSERNLLRSKTPNSNTMTSVIYYPYAYSNLQCIFGTQDSGTDNRFYGLISSTNYKVQINSSSLNSSFLGISNSNLINGNNGTFTSKQQLVTLAIDNYNKQVDVKSEELIKSFKYGTDNFYAADLAPNCSYNLILGNISTAGTCNTANAFRGKIYKCIIKESDELVRDFRPCMVAGTIGMYDMVTGKLYTNANASGGGTFNAV